MYQARSSHLLITVDDGIVVDMAEHFEELVSVRIADLAQSVDARFDQVDVGFKQVDARFDAVDARFDAVDTRFDAIDAELKTVARFDEVRDHFGEMRDFTTHCFDKLRSEMRVDFGRVERRLDRHEELLGEVLREVRALRPKSEAPPAAPPHPES